jgi:3-deoxy-D-manno-octulosonic-acid transferase
LSIIFYHVFLWFYKVGILLVAPWNRKAKEWLDGRKGIFERMRADFAGDAAAGRGTGGGAGDAVGAAGGSAGKYPVIWMHCASLGEFEQGRPVIEALRRETPMARIVLTFFSPSGYRAKKDYEGADYVYYLPLDSPGNARQFIGLVCPTLVLWVKYDYWYYYLVELKKRAIPVLLVSGVFRADQPFFKWYGRLHRYMLECMTHLFVQTEASRVLLEGRGLTGQVSVSGDTRFDRVIEIAREGAGLPLIETWCEGHQVIVAGSTWAEDEEELDHYANTRHEVRFILAPHEIGEDRLVEVERLFRHCIRYSVWATGAGALAAEGRGSAGAGLGTGSRPGWPEPNVLIIDNIGMLSRLYQYATIAYVGGGFGDDGVHNVLEAAVYGKPVIFGPVIEKYIEAVELTESGGGIVIDSALEAEAVFERLLRDPGEVKETGEASARYVDSKKGATEKIVRYIYEKRLLTS